MKEKGCDVGFAFDCDGDRLVLVDGEGRKRTGDFMLTLAIKEILPAFGTARSSSRPTPPRRSMRSSRSSAARPTGPRWGRPT